MKSKHQIEDLYPLSPVQHGILFHSLYEPNSGVYLVQKYCTLRGDLNIAAFERAWQRVVERHPILRTSFMWEGLDEPVQIVNRQVQPRLKQLDWSKLTREQQQRQLDDYLETERKQDFNLAEAPLMRFVLIRISADAYKFIWTYHHLILDGWCYALLLGEVFTLYEAFSEGREVDLKQSRPFRDYIAWLRQHELNGAESFWRKRLGGITAPTSLRVDQLAEFRPAPQQLYGEENVSLTVETTQALQALARSHRLTMYTLVQGAWSLLLQRYSGDADVVFGEVVSGRPADLIGVEEMMGVFINTLPVRVAVKTDSFVLPWLSELQERQVESRQYEHTPLVQVQRWSEVPAGTLLFNSLLVYENYPVDLTLAERGGAIKVEDLLVVQAANYPITMTAGPVPELMLNIKYDATRFDVATIRRMLNHVRTLLEAIAANPHRRLADLPMLTNEELECQLVEWNDTSVDYPQGQTLHQLFTEQTLRTPDAIALIFGEERLTYRELDRRATHLASYLRGQGVGPEVLVGVCMERSVEMIVALLGTLKAGAAYVPLDPSYPSARLAFMFADAKLSVLLTQERLVATLPSNSAQIVCLDSDWPSIEAASNETQPGLTTSGNLAYVIYTSGSTGKPKGVAITHHSAVTLVHWAKENFTPEELSGVLASTSIVFDLSIFEMFVPLSTGGTVILAENALQLPELAAKAEVRLINTVPSAITELVRTNSVPETVLVVNLAGEPLTRKLVQQIYDTTNVRRVWNLYGPSEDTTYSTQVMLDRDSQYGVTIGRPLAATQIYLLDRQMRPVPIGVIGEIYIAGEGLARGYLHRPELTAEKFIPNPFSDQPGTRLYCTGDLGRYLPGGEIVFLGRADHQVKIRGFRVELGEIESVLSRHPAVRRCVVVVNEDQQGNKQLVAYIVNTDDAATTNDLRNFLKQSLPAHMVPNIFIALPELPLTPNGKIDRKALPAPEPAQTVSGHDALQTPTQEMLAGIWCEVLGITEVGANDNFFDLGGHSLLATQISSRLREVFQIELPLRKVFETPVVSELAQLIDQTQRERSGLESPPLTRVSRERELPLSFAQQRLWFLYQMAPQNSFYNISASVRLNGAVNVPVLEQTLNEMLRRHESLRTKFAMQNGHAVQVVVPELRLALKPEDLTHLSAAEQESEVQRASEVQINAPFDLAEAPLLRVKLLKFAEEDHVMLFTMHHIIADGWSMDVLVREVGALYQAYLRGESSPLPELEIQYADYAVWQRDWLTGDVLDQQLAYWQEQLAGAPTVLELPTDKPRPPVQSYRGATLVFSFSRELTAKLHALSRREVATLYMMILSAVEVLLYRYSGQQQMLIGMPIANRTRLQVEKLIGFFVNQLVVKGEVRGDQKFIDLLRHVREVVLGAYTNQDVPFERVVETLNPERDMSRSPLFQVVFSWQNAPSSRLKLENIELSPVEIEHKAVRYDIELVLWEDEGRIFGHIDYDTDLYEEATIRRMSRHLTQLLESITNDPNQYISNLDLLEDSEKRQLAQWNQTLVDYPQDVCIHELLETQAKQTPDATAVVSEGVSLTYSELNGRANQLAHHLRSFGIGPDSIVALRVAPSLEMVIGMLGILKSGAAYLPIDPGLPPERVNYLLDDTRAQVLLTQSGLAQLDYDAAPLVISLDADWDTIARQSTAEPAVALSPDNLAYVIYTSGSTGKPKGVLLPHRGLVNHNLYCVERYGLKSGDRVLQFASIGFDVAAEEIFPTLLSGATLVLWPKRRSSGFDALLELIEDESISVLNLPAAYWHEWVADLDRTREQVPDNLRLLIVGSDKVISEHLSQWQKLLWHDVQVLNAYGLTEATITSTIYEPSASVHSHLLPIGRPIANSQIHLLDKTLNPVPIGFPGELYIGGDGLARGYLNQTERTAERFIPDPFSTIAGARLYRTGDLARYLPDGNLEILGRADEQVKIRGFRIEPGEIESVLLQYEGVIESVVVVREDEPGNKHLVAYLVADPEATLEIKELRAYLREHLPEYMMPARFQLLERLPLTTNGKVDRQALPAPDTSHHELTGHEHMNWTPTQEMLEGIWGEVLGLDQVGLDDNFFELGGHSLLATQSSSRVQEAFGVEFSLHNFFETPVFRDMAELLEETHRSGHGVKPAPLVRMKKDQAVPLSYAQQRLWFLDQLEPGNPFYNCPGAARLKGQLDVEVLERSINEVIRRHESLRTTFPAIDGQPRQVIADEMYVYLTVEDLSYLAPNEAEAEAERYIAEEAQQPFDLVLGPLLSVRLLRLGVDDHIVTFTMHHIIADGWSTGVLVREIGTLYEAFSTGKSSPLPELPIQYSDYALWQREWLSGEVLERQLNYWKDHLAGAPPLLALPTDQPRPEEQTFRGARLPVVVDDELSESLRGLSRRKGVTMFMTLFAAFNVVLSYYSGSEDLVVSTDLANRDRIETEGLIGFFVNQLPLRTNLGGDPTFSELLERVRKVALGSYAHEHISLDRLVEALNPERSLQYTPLFQVNLTFQNTPEASVALPGLTISPVEMKVITAQLDLSINFAEVDRALVGALEYKTDLFNASTMQQLIDDLLTILKLVAEDAELRVSEVKHVVAEQSRERQLIRATGIKEATRRKLTERRRSTPITEIIPDTTSEDIPLVVA